MTKYVKLDYTELYSISELQNEFLLEMENNNNNCDFMEAIATKNNTFKLIKGYKCNDISWIDYFYNLFNFIFFRYIWFYNHIINNTENTINGIYNFLKLPTYKHQYDNIENTLQEDIKAYGMPEMHNVRPTITRSNNNPEEILSKKIIEKYSGLEFWRRK